MAIMHEKEQVLFPTSRLLAIDKDIREVEWPKLAPELGVPRVHSYGRILELCRDRGIRVMQRQKLPDEVDGLTLYVEGYAFVALGEHLWAEGQGAPVHVLAHEAAHILLGHPQGFGTVMLNRDRAMNKMDDVLLELVATESEIQAELLGMRLVVPDEFLHSQVDTSVWIPTNRIAEEQGIDYVWMAQRVGVYRRVFGYERSKKVFLKGHAPDLSLGSEGFEKWVSGLEDADTMLSTVLPSISPEAWEQLVRHGV